MRSRSAVLVPVLIALLQTAIATPAPAAPPAAREPETVVTTTHAIRLDGKDLRYTAEAGRLVLTDSARGVARGAIFYVAYRVAAYCFRLFTISTSCSRYRPEFSSLHPKLCRQ